MKYKYAKLILKKIKFIKITDIFRTIFMCLTVFFSALIFSSAVLFWYPFTFIYDKNKHSLHFLANLWAKFIKITNPWWSFNIQGKEHLAKKNSPAIYAANHQSQADILALFILETRFRWVSKASLFKIPLFGWGMSAIGYVPVDRNSKRSGERCMYLSGKILKNKIPMVFFPEGTRSKTGKLGSFKKGAFRLSKAMNVPIIPITIDGCYRMLPKGSIKPSRAEVSITIHPQIDPTNFTVDELLEETKKSINTKLGEFTKC